MTPKPGVPFSAVTPSMWPPDLSDEDCGYDELGFRIEEEDGPEQSSKKLLGIPFTEDPSVRLQWLAYLEFSHSREEVHELSWDSIPEKLPLTEKLWEMMTTHAGIPHSLRPQMWCRLSGAFEKKCNPANLPYYKVVRESTRNEYFSYAKHIEKDLFRILPGNGCFCKSDSPGIPRLRRVLRSIAWLYPDVGYCQGFGTVVAHLLLFLEEEDCFWLMSTVIEDILPASYFTSDFLGIRVDALVFGHFLAAHFPEVDALLKEHDIELGLIAFTWFMTLFASVVHVKILLRIWDHLFAEGSMVVFKVMLAMVKLKVKDLLLLKNSAEIFNFLSDLPSELDEFELLEISSFEDVNSNAVEKERKKCFSKVVNDGSVFSTKCRQVKKRDVRRPPKNPSGVSVLKSIFGDFKGHDDLKSKNIRQTEIAIELHEAILAIGRHFMSHDQNYMTVSLDPDFSLDSHAKDHQRFTLGFNNGYKRAKSLVDFERKDDDELGFRKNDIITIVNSKDEHCWVGELNGLRGWFPAKCVQLLDERSKQYCAAGDDSVTDEIADLVRGRLCPALKRIFECGMRKPGTTVGPIHPWLFIEEVALKEIEKDFNSVYSRLVLCKTYRLDEDGKVLSPEELLYRSVELVNRSHEKVQMDVKMRSLICLGINEQVLHLWIEIFCSCSDVITKWYHPWSFLNSPGWIGLKCELRILSQFSFTLNPNWELRMLKEQQKLDVKHGVRDMLVKHHLFSWNL
ncbi:small G protein signaling modulator 3 isoform X2 [Folsomia candida]|nr:small G protein signaling modulator 3 isoform X2 [Folsomia candida]XP_035710858.1 small G protein signaling modulator 3 isoform X2 [Folsomia candida]